MSLGHAVGLVAVGAIIGILARLALPGRQNVSILATLVLGVVARPDRRLRHGDRTTEGLSGTNG